MASIVEYDVFVLPSKEKGRPAGFPDEGVVGDDVDYYHLRRKRAVAYERYRPYMHGPRHAALFRTSEKLLEPPQISSTGE